MKKRFFPLLFLITTILLLLSGCIVKQSAEYAPSATIQGGLGMNFFDFHPQPGPNDVLIFRRSKAYLFPPVRNLTYLFIEIQPELMKVHRKYEIPSEQVFGRVCKEVHPGFWCGPITGEIQILNIAPKEIDCRIYIEAKAEKGWYAAEGYQWSLGGEYSFIKRDVN